jgi:hypothetical protein
MASEKPPLRYIEKRDIITGYGLRRKTDAVKKGYPRPYIKELK